MEAGCQGASVEPGRRRSYVEASGGDTLQSSAEIQRDRRRRYELGGSASSRILNLGSRVGGVGVGYGKGGATGQ